MQHTFKPVQPARSAAPPHRVRANMHKDTHRERIFSRTLRVPSQALQDMENDTWEAFRPSERVLSILSESKAVTNFCRALAAGRMPEPMAKKLLSAVQMIVEFCPDHRMRLRVLEGIYEAVYPSDGGKAVDVSPLLSVLGIGIKSIWPDVREAAAKNLWGIAQHNGSARPFMSDLIVALRDEDQRVVEHASQAMMMILKEIMRARERGEPISKETEKLVNSALAEFAQILLAGKDESERDPRKVVEEKTLMLIAAMLSRAHDLKMLPPDQV